eukprot:gb/GEZN01008910.1/.p1 GENE.gb/GEZN01008910.1/~~gb/GEZN01008910.1/.p1  ORF type:complete len:411 (+),score=51.44 gb/GEZN01008910.1/:113-1345(+)
MARRQLADAALLSFQSKLKELMALLDSRTELDNKDPVAIQVADGLEELQRILVGASHVLSDWDLQQSQKVIKDLEERRDQLRPRVKFKFKARKGRSQPKAEANTIDLSHELQPAFSSTQNGTVGLLQAHATGTHTMGSTAASAVSPVKLHRFPFFHDCVGKRFQLQKLEAGQDLHFTGLTGCRVEVSAPSSALQVHGCQDCIFLVAPIAGAVRLDSLKNCVIVLASRQIRLFDCQNCDLYMFVLSHPVIERCAGIRVTPYNLEYPSVARHLVATNLAGRANMWDQVDDFNWLRATNSPNWGVLPAANTSVSDDAIASASKTTQPLSVGCVSVKSPLIIPKSYKNLSLDSKVSLLEATTACEGGAAQPAQGVASRESSMEASVPSPYPETKSFVKVLLGRSTAIPYFHIGE